MGFLNPVIPTETFVQSRNPNGHFLRLASRHTFDPESRPHFALKSRILAVR